MLFSALDPRIGRVMFSKLARAVLDLDTERRQALLRRTILPGLLDGRIDATVLQDFPDVDLAESLCLLLDLETAAPEVVTTALSACSRETSAWPCWVSARRISRGVAAPTATWASACATYVLVRSTSARACASSSSARSAARYACVT